MKVPEGRIPPLSPGQARVLLYLQENARDGECYRYVAEIAGAVDLIPSYVRKTTSHFVKLGLISREQMWELNDPEEESESIPRVVTAKEGELRNYVENGTYHPAGNHYKILQPEEINTILTASTRGSLCKLTPVQTSQEV